MIWILKPGSLCGRKIQDSSRNVLSGAFKPKLGSLQTKDSSRPPVLIMKQLSRSRTLLRVFIGDGYLGGVCFVWGNKYLKEVTEEGYAAVMMLLIHRLTLLWWMLSGYIIFMPPR